MSEEKLRHLGDEEPPEGVYTAAEKALVAYARTSTLAIAVDDDVYGTLEKHYTREQIMEVWAIVGVANMINRFHATFHTDVEEETMESVEAGNIAGSCPLRFPEAPARG